MNFFIHPLRTFNQRSIFLGLSQSDLWYTTFIGIGLMWGLEFLHFPLILGFLWFLILIPLSYIRLNYRRKIIRDTLCYFLLSKKIYDPRKFYSRTIRHHSVQ